MFIDVVVFNQSMESVFVSNKTLNFFNDYSIDYLRNESFPIEKLRLLYKNDKNLFFYVLTELSLIGCDFYSKIPNTIFPSIIGKEYARLVCNDNSSFNPKEVSFLQIDKLFLNFERHTKKSLNGISILRLNQFLKGDVCSILLKNGFSSAVADDSNKIEISKNNLDSEDIKNICIPKFYIKFITTFWVCVPELIQAYNELGVVKYRDLLELKSTECERCLKVIKKKVPNLYLQGKYVTDLCLFLKEKEEFTFLLKNCGLTLDIFFDAKSDFKDDSFYLLKKYLLFSLNDSEYSIDNFLNDKSNFNNVCVPCSAANYLKQFGIESLIYLKNIVFNSNINSIRLNNYDDYLCACEFEPYVVLENIEAEINMSFVENEEKLDREYRKLFNNLPLKEFRNEVSLKYKNSQRIDMYYDIITRRDGGETLDSIGRDYKITRERIRQIAAKFLKRTAKDYLKFINCVFDNMCYFPISECLKIEGLAQFLDSEFNTTKYMIAYDFGVVTEQKKYNQIKSFVTDNKYEIGFDIFNSFIDLDRQPFNFSGYLINGDKILSYNPYPSFGSIKKNTAINVANLYLDKKGIKGFDANNDIEEAKAFFAQYGINDLKATDRVIVSRIQRCDYVLVGMSRYAKADFITNEMIETAKKVFRDYEIDKDFGTVVKDIYNANEKVLNNVGIDNYYFLYGLGSKYRMCRYTYSGRSMRIFNGKEKTFEEVVEAYMRRFGPIVSSKKISEDLGVREVAFDQIGSITKFDSDTFIKCSNIRCDGYQKTKLFYFIESKIKNDSFCLAEDILKSPLYFDKDFNHFFKDNMLTTGTRLAYALDVIARHFRLTKFRFSHWINAISYVDNPILTMPDVVYSHFKGVPFSKKQLYDYLDDLNLGGQVSRKEFLKSYVVRVGNDSYVCAKEYKVDVKEIELILNILNSSANDEIYLTANEALIKLKVKGISHSFSNNPIGLCSALSFYTKSNWIRPRNNLNYDNASISILLLNRRFFEELTIKDLILKFILKEEKTYLSYNDINDLLLTNEIISTKLPYDVFKLVFAQYLDSNGLVCIKK